MTKVSFVIPAKNEEAMLPATLDVIHGNLKDLLSYEIIVIDNGSSDNTVKIAKAKNAHVITQEAGTIGSLRNTGVKHASGSCIVFLDADVSLTESWVKPFIGVVDALDKNPNIITGSRCTADSSAGWIAKAWFRKAPSIHQTTHVGTGHMITSKSLFNLIGGFDEKLQTGEDYDFCGRARKLGAHVFENRHLKVIHHGMPRTIREFLIREIWHGTGDASSIKKLINSKVAILSLVFLVAHSLLITSILMYPRGRAIILLTIFIIVVICASSSLKKYYYAPSKVVLQNMLLFYCYYWGRSISILIHLLHINGIHNPRIGRT